MDIIWIIVIGFVAGLTAKFLMEGNNEPKGFLLTTLRGIVGASRAFPGARIALVRFRKTRTERQLDSVLFELVLVYVGCSFSGFRHRKCRNASHAEPFDSQEKNHALSRL